MELEGRELSNANKDRFFVFYGFQLDYSIGGINNYRFFQNDCHFRKKMFPYLRDILIFLMLTRKWSFKCAFLQHRIQKCLHLVLNSVILNEVSSGLIFSK